MKHIKFFILTITCLFIKNNILAQQEPIITEKNTVCEIANYDMSNYYTTKSIITTLSESDTLFTIGTYEAKQTKHTDGKVVISNSPHYLIVTNG